MERTNLIFITISLVSALFTSSFAQQRVVTGQINTSNGLEPIAYASIMVAKTSVGTISNDTGEFRLVIPESASATDSLMFSCIGYQSYKVALLKALSQQPMLVKLDASSRHLKEVTVTPLTLAQLIDSLVIHTNKVFTSEVKWTGYYREFTYTNLKCTEYADALMQVYYKSLPQPIQQLKIIASRCERAIASKTDSNNFKNYFVDSKVNPNMVIGYATLNELIKRYYPEKRLNKYSYRIKTDELTNDIIVEIYPKQVDPDNFLYKSTFILSEDFNIKYYKLFIPDDQIADAKEANILGIHSKITGLYIEARYTIDGTKIYPQYLRFTNSFYVKGKSLGTTISQTITRKSEFVITAIDPVASLPFATDEIYKKGNICNNGAMINPVLLQSYNFIKPTKSDSLEVKDLSPIK